MISPYLTPLRSGLKLEIMLSLLRGAKRLAELKSEVGSGETTILHALRDLEAINLTVKSGMTYRLTPLGVIEALIMEDASSAVEVLERFKDFWLLHDITAIPPRFLRRIGALKESTLVRVETLELSKVHKTFLEILLTSERIRGISPIFHPDFVAAFKQLLGQGASVELILTSVVLKRTLTLADPELMAKYLEKERLKMFLRDGLGIALTMTENAFSLGLFKPGGEYDYDMDLVSHSQEALEWGKELFQHYLRGARRIRQEDLNL